MNSDLPSFYNEPQIQYLQDLLREIKDGYLHIPPFQRPFVWTKEQRLELLNSIRDAIPMGHVMVWRTNYDKIKCYDVLGGIPLKPPSSSAPRQYILDGVQRLSTLFGALTPRPDQDLHNGGEEGSEDAEDFNVWYDLEEEEFVTTQSIQSTQSVPSVSQQLPLNILFQTVPFIKFQRGFPPEKTVLWTTRSDALLQAFRTYKIPILAITTDDLSKATRTFQRVNSQGSIMEEAHMIHALTWTPQFDLREKLQQVREEKLAPYGWEGLSDDMILRQCKTGLKLDQLHPKPDELSEKLKKNPDIIQQSGNLLSLMAQFMETECHLPLPELVPYPAQIYLMAEVFRKYPEPDEYQRQILKEWFWATGLSEYFGSGSTPSRQRVNQSDLLEMLKYRWYISFSGNSTIYLQPFRSHSLSRGHARAKVLTLLYGRWIAKHLIDKQRIQELLKRYGQNSIQPILRSQDDVYKITGLRYPGNYFLLSQDKVSSVRHHLDNIRFGREQDSIKGVNDGHQKEGDKRFEQSFDDPKLAKFWKMHFISDRARECLHNNNIEEFIQVRQKSLEDCLNGEILDLCGPFVMKSRKGFRLAVAGEGRWARF